MQIAHSGHASGILYAWGQAMHQGFILQNSYRIEAGKPVVLIYGKLEEGGSFLIRDSRQVPSFHIRSADVIRAAGNWNRSATSKMRSKGFSRGTCRANGCPSTSGRATCERQADSCKG